MSLDAYNDSAKRAPIVVDVHKEALVKRGYRDFADWAA
jgi:23S rRNA G2445 N2-methylase RlmL